MSSVAPRDIVRIGKMALADHIDQLVSHRPGMTELALAKSLFGRVGYQQRVNSTCRRLFREGHLERNGTGGPGHSSPITQEEPPSSPIRLASGSVSRRKATQMNRLLALAALSLFLGLDASHAQTSLHKQRVDEQIDETSCASANWLSRTAQLAESTQSDVREAVSSAIEICGDSARLSGNYVIAMKWWRRAADRGNPSAQMKLAYF